MKTKGSTVMTLVKFVTERFGNDGFETWVSSLPEETQGEIRFILASSWYPVQETLVLPFRRMCEMFFSGDTVGGAKTFGEYSAKHQLTGIYRLLLKIGSPNAMLSVASTSWRMFYSEGSLRVISNEKGRAVLRIQEVPIQDSLWAHGTAIWFERALEMAGAKNASVTVTQAATASGNEFEFTMEWH